MLCHLNVIILPRWKQVYSHDQFEVDRGSIELRAFESSIAAYFRTLEIKTALPSSPRSLMHDTTRNMALLLASSLPE